MPEPDARPASATSARSDPPDDGTTSDTPAKGRPVRLGLPAVLLVMLLAAPVAVLVGMEGLAFPAFWDPMAPLAWLSPREARGGLVERSEPPVPRLLIQEASGTAGEPLQLDMSLQGEADGAFVMITGLIPGMTLSMGTAVGANGWRVQATDFAEISIGPPAQFVGAVDLTVELHLADQSIADRQQIRLEWAATVAPANQPVATQPPAPVLAAGEPGEKRAEADPPVAVRNSTVPPPTSKGIPDANVASASPAVPGLIPAVPPPAAAVPASPQLDRETIAILVERGKMLFASGDLAAARLALRRAADSKDAAAALMLGSTYDPVVLRALKVFGLEADVAMARFWYEKAKEFGSPEASRRLEILADGTR